MPPLHKHNRMQFLPNVSQTATPKLQIPAFAHKMQNAFFFGGREWGNPSSLSAFLFFMLVIVIGQLSTMHKKKKREKNPNIVSLCLKFLAFHLNYFLFFPFQGGNKKKRRGGVKSYFPASVYSLYTVLSIFYHNFF